MALVLIVEDEPMLRASMRRGLERVPGLEVVDAGGVADAIELLEARRPDLLVSDLNLPDGTGLELLPVVERVGPTPVVFVTAWLGAYESQLAPAPHVELYEKPLPIARLREIVARHVNAAPSTHVSPFAVSDYLQLAQMGRHSVELEIGCGGVEMGRVTVVRGDAWDAQAGGRRGDEALAALVTLAECSVSVQRLDHVPERRIRRPLQALLLEAVRRDDEVRAGRTLPPSVIPPEPDPEPPPAPEPATPDAPSIEVEALLEEGLSALLERDYERAWRVFSDVQARSPGRSAVEANLNRLRDMGYGDGA